MSKVDKEGKSDGARGIKNDGACGNKNDTGKPPITLFPMRALAEACRVFAMGAKKYSRHNFRNGLAPSRTIDACFRHLMAWVEGEDNDYESGENHLAHAMCELAMTIESMALHPELDDRFKSPVKIDFGGRVKVTKEPG